MHNLSSSRAVIIADKLDKSTGSIPIRELYIDSWLIFASPLPSQRGCSIATELRSNVNMDYGLCCFGRYFLYISILDEMYQQTTAI